MDHLTYQTQIRQLFTEAVSGPENRLDLARTALLIASEAYPGLDILRYVAKLEVMAAAVRPAVTTTDDPSLKIQSLNAYLFEERGFRGNALRELAPRRTVVGITPGGAIVVPAPVDYLSWTAAIARVAERKDLKAPRRGLWISGRMSGLAHRELSRLGWAFHEVPPLVGSR